MLYLLTSLFFDISDGDSSTHKDVAREKLPGGDSGFANYLHFSAGCSIETVEEDGKKVTKTTEESYAQPFILFMIAQLLLGCGGSPLFTLGITYVDDHVPTESSSVYIGKKSSITSIPDCFPYRMNKLRYAGVLLYAWIIFPLQGLYTPWPLSVLY